MNTKLLEMNDLSSFNLLIIKSGINFIFFWCFKNYCYLCSVNLVWGRRRLDALRHGRPTWPLVYFFCLWKIQSEDIGIIIQ